MSSSTPAPSGAARRWLSHDMSRPRPPAAAPNASAGPVAAPAGTVSLFDGTSLSGWVGRDGEPAAWSVRDGYMEVLPGSGDIRTTRTFGDVHLHIEWAAPEVVKGSGQGRGNSGIFLMGLYEIQVLDSYENDTYPDGLAGALYGQHPPLYNAALPPGQWQTYDIAFRRPRFDEVGNLRSPARMTIFLNGVLVQNNTELAGPTSWMRNYPYTAHPARLPLGLQDHGDLVRFRAIWVRELPEEDAPTTPDAASEARMHRLAGSYAAGGSFRVGLAHAEGRLWLEIMGRRLSLVAEGEGSYRVEGSDTVVTPAYDAGGAPTGLSILIGGSTIQFQRQEG